MLTSGHRHDVVFRSISAVYRPASTAESCYGVTVAVLQEDTFAKRLPVLIRIVFVYLAHHAGCLIHFVTPCA